MILGTWQPNTPDWYAARADRVGGSDIGAVCGWSKYASQDQIMAEKMGSPRGETAAMIRGRILEPAIIAYLCQRFELTVDAEASAATYAADDNPRHLYSPDALTPDWLLLEAKTTSNRSDEEGWGRAGTDLVPLPYQAQAQWGMYVLDLPECRLGVLAGAHNDRPNLHFQTYLIRRDSRVIDYMRRRADHFLADLDAKKEQQP